MQLITVLERYAQLEKRAVILYRSLAERFAANAVAARIWRELSNTEASHFALLELAQDWAAMGKGGGEPPVTAEALDLLVTRHGELEAAAERCTLEDAVGLTIAWEELELPRIAALLPHLPAPAQGRVMAGMIGEAPEHYRLLEELVEAAGGPGHAERVEALAAEARAALG